MKKIREILCLIFTGHKRVNELLWQGPYRNHPEAQALYTCRCGAGGGYRHAKWEKMRAA